MDIDSFYLQNKEILNRFNCSDSLNVIINILRPNCDYNIIENGPIIIMSNNIIISTPTDEEINNTKYMINKIKPIYLLRKLRDSKLKESDLFILPDFPKSQGKYEQIYSYRQTLRDLPVILQNTEIDINNLEQYIPNCPI